MEKCLRNNKGGITLNQSKLITLLFVDDQIVFANKEDNLQKAVHNLNKIAMEFNMKISTSKTKTMSFQGKEAI